MSHSNRKEAWTKLATDQITMQQIMTQVQPSSSKMAAAFGRRQLGADNAAFSHEFLAHENVGMDDWSVPEFIRNHAYFVDIGHEGNMLSALIELDKKMIAAGEHHLITHKTLHAVGGKVIEPGEVGLISFNGKPVLALKPGRYWNLSITHDWIGKRLLTEPCDFNGLTFAQVGQGECLVVQAPNNQIFCIRNGGFAAYGPEGRYRIIDIVDTLNLGDQFAVKEASTKQIIGWKREISTKVQTSDKKQVQATVATFYNVPANHVLLLQQSDKLIELAAGQHVVTNTKTTFRGFFSLAERQTTFQTNPAYTVEGVPVILHVNLRYRLEKALLLAKHYDDAFMAMRNPAQSAVNAVVSRMSYQQFMRAKRMQGDIPDHDHLPWLDAFKNECMKELGEQAAQYGIVLESFTVLDRSLEGTLGKDLEKQAESVLKNQIKATQIELENHIAIETKKGQLKVAEVEALTTKTLADAGYYSQSRQADAKYYEAMQLAKADIESSALRAQQDSENVVKLANAKKQEIEMLAEARGKEISIVAASYDGIRGAHTGAILLAEIDIAKNKSLPERTIYFGGSTAAAGDKQSSNIATGFATALGAGMSAKF